MRFRARMTAFVAFASMGLASFGYGIAQAQNAPPPANPPAGDANAALQRPVNLSPEEMKKQGDQHLGRIEIAATTVRRMLEKAREDRDVVKTLCLNDKLTQLDVTYRSAKERRSALEAAVNRKDNELAAHEFTILGVYKSRADRLLAEANQCVGSEVGIIGDTRVTTSIDPTIPDDLGSPPAVPDVPITVPPPSCASCSI